MRKSSSEDKRSQVESPRENVESPTRKSRFRSTGSSSSKKKKEAMQATEKIEPKYVDLEEVSD